MSRFGVSRVSFMSGAVAGCLSSLVSTSVVLAGLFLNVVPPSEAESARSKGETLTSVNEGDGDKASAAGLLPASSSQMGAMPSVMAPGLPKRKTRVYVTGNKLKRTIKGDNLLVYVRGHDNQVLVVGGKNDLNVKGHRNTIRYSGGKKVGLLVFNGSNNKVQGRFNSSKIIAGKGNTLNGRAIGRGTPIGSKDTNDVPPGRPVTHINDPGTDWSGLDIGGGFRMAGSTLMYNGKAINSCTDLVRSWRPKQLPPTVPVVCDGKMNKAVGGTALIDWDFWAESGAGDDYFVSEGILLNSTIKPVYLVEILNHESWHWVSFSWSRAKQQSFLRTFGSSGGWHGSSNAYGAMGRDYYASPVEVWANTGASCYPILVEEERWLNPEVVLMPCGEFDYWVSKRE